MRNFIHTRIDFQYQDNKRAAEALAKICSHFVEAAPKLLDGLTPDPEWVNDYDPDKDRAVIRNGPQYLLDADWEKKQNRQIKPADFTELVVQFRVCKV